MDSAGPVPSARLQEAEHRASNISDLDGRASWRVASVTQAGVAELRRAVGVEERQQLVGEVDPLLPLDQSLLHICTEEHLLY